MQIVGLVTHSTITMVTKWRQVCFTSSVKYFPALHSDLRLLPTVKSIKGTARGFIEIKTQREPSYSFLALRPWVQDSLLITPAISNYFLTAFLEGRVERTTLYLHPQPDCRFWQAHCPGFPCLTSKQEQIENLVAVLWSQGLFSVSSCNAEGDRKASKEEETLSENNHSKLQGPLLCQNSFLLVESFLPFVCLFPACGGRVSVLCSHFLSVGMRGRRLWHDLKLLYLRLCDRVMPRKKDYRQ